jgi:hypothetical protein
MALYGKTDAAASAPKWLSADSNAIPQMKKSAAFFVDTTEAGVTSNRAAGLRTPGWNLFTTYTDTNGNTRRRVESLVPMKVTAAAAGDLGVSGSGDDSTVADS